MRLLATKVVELLLICIKVHSSIEHGFLVVNTIRQLFNLDILFRMLVTLASSFNYRVQPKNYKK